MKTPLLFCLAVCCLSVSALAQSQAEMNAEAARDAAKADKELNRVYQRVLADLDEEGVKKLKASQRAWIAYRDAEAERAADEARGGSMAPLLYSGTLATLTNERVQRLKETLGEDTAPRAKPVDEPAPQPKPKPQAKVPDEPTLPDGAKTQAQAAQLFFDAYKAHDRRAAQSVATDKALNKLLWDRKAGDNNTLKLMDNTHIYYEGGSIELVMKRNDEARWIITEVKLYAD